MTDHHDVSPRPTSIPDDDSTRTLVMVHADHSDVRHVALGGGTYTILISGKDTAGRYCLIDMHVPSGGGPERHRHDFEEMYTILDGEIEFTFRGDVKFATAGMTVNIPANAPHSFHNVSGSPARMLCMCAPAGQDEFFLALGIPLESRTAVAPPLGTGEKEALRQRAVALAPQYLNELL